ncbi:MAG TPA: ATP-binding protein [Anaerolineae bacterium]|jgi:signal transduction histidine kinase
MSDRIFISFSGHKPAYSLLARPEQSQTGGDPSNGRTTSGDKAVEKLAAGIAHHFNNAFQSIISAAELAYFHADTPELVKEDLTRIAEQSKQTAQLAQQLLDFSCQPITDQRTVDLAALARDLAPLLKITLPPEIRFSLDIEPGPEAYTLTAIPGQIRQALINLVANAQEAMPSGGLIELRLAQFKPSCDEPTPWSDRQADQWLVLAVSDTGRGIPPDNLPYIFDPFFTTKPIGQGAGLGLAQVYGIVKQHNGKIEVESKPGRGTTISLYWPIILPVSEQKTTQRAMEKHNGTGEPLVWVLDVDLEGSPDQVSPPTKPLQVKVPS